MSYIFKDCILYDEENFTISDIQFNNSQDSMGSKSEYRNLCALWRAVILQAIIDSVNNSSRTEDKIAKYNAISWLSNQSQDFRIVCQLAEYNKDYVIKKTSLIINKQKNKRRKNEITHKR